MPQPIAVFDIDGTLYRSNLLVDLVNSLIELGIFPAKVAGLYQEAYASWRRQRHREAYDEYMDQLVQTYLRFIRGVTVDELAAAVELVANRAFELMYVFGRELVSELEATHCLVAISGAPQEAVERLMRPFGFEHCRGAQYQTLDGVYTGEAVPGHLRKAETAMAIAVQYGLTFDDGVAMGDTHSDAPLLRLVEGSGRPIAFHPNKELLEESVERDWEIVYERKDTVAHLRGGRFERIGAFGHYYSF